jgi:methyl-accepting chemotaxis protein
MKTLLTVWNDRSAAFKLTLVCCLSTFGILVPSALYLSQLRAAHAVSRTELDSMAPLGSMLELVAALNLRLGALDPAGPDATRDLAPLYADTLARVSSQPHLVASRQQLAALAQQWPSVQASAPDDPALLGHAAQALVALDTLRDESALVYTPHVDSYHLVIGATRAQPEAGRALAALLSDIRQRGADVEDGMRATLRHQLAGTLQVYVREVDKALALRPDAGAALHAAHAALRDAPALSDPQAPAPLLSELSGRLDASREAALAELQRQSGLHLASARQRMGWGLALALLVTGLIVAVSWYTVRKLSQGIREAARIASRIAGGELDNPIPEHARDEIGQLFRSMDAMQSTVRRVVASQREMAARHEAGTISYRCDETAFPGGFAEMVRGTNALVAAHIQVKMRLVEVIQRYAVGDLSVDMDVLPGEKAVLTRAMDEAKRNLQAINADIRRLAAASAAGDFSQRGDAQAYEYDFQAMIASLNQLMETADANLSSLSQVLRSVADGDLTREMQGDFHGVFARMRDDANATVRQLRTIVGGIQDATGSINLAAAEISAGNADLARRTEQQAASLEETAATMEQFTATVQQNAAAARQADRHAADASSLASDGGQVMGKAVATMGQIEQSSRRISEIISVIDGIAFQTNILALNAAVEAARAGEQGRGFAVVAAEVRSLAQRSATAAREIKHLIETSVHDIGAGSALVGEAGTSMERVVAAVQRVSGIIAEISAASQEQAIGIEQVSQSIAQIDEGTQRNAALVEQASAAARSMEQQAQDLRAGVSRFRTGGPQPSADARRYPQAAVAA